MDGEALYSPMAGIASYRYPLSSAINLSFLILHTHGPKSIEINLVHMCQTGMGIHT
jgi:hypothetical protein